ncbi:MAG: hypothetical protein L0227_17555 [Chloroflexi bacterium]|nr:hypothetical protein [Chloroflexota bacterium]
MDEQTVRTQAEAFGDALVAGDVDRAIKDLSDELRRNLGEVLALLPLPARDVTVESVDLSGSGYNVVLRLAGESNEDRIQTRWKDRDGQPRIVEASHLSRTERPMDEDLETEEAAAEPADT